MDVRIKEAELPQTELRNYTEFLLAAPAETGTGVPVYQQKVLPPFSGQFATGSAVSAARLVIEVVDPDDVATIERLRTAITEKLRAS